MSFIERANFPKAKVKTAIISDLDSKIIEYIRSFKINLLFTEKNKHIDSAIAQHADINCFYIGNGKIILDNSQKRLFSSLNQKNFIITKPNKPVAGDYPSDCRLNCLAIGKKLIARKASTDFEILKQYNEDNILNVRQGYARCSICVVNESAIITDDTSIYSVCTKNGFDVLLIDKGDICLPGHDYGFIGGACTLIDKNKMIFFGDISKHRSYLKIAEFLNKHGCEYFYLHDHALIDIGGVIPIEEV